MKIGFDAKKAIVNRTGIGNYSRRVAVALSETYPDDGFVMFGPRKQPVEPIATRENLSYAYPPAFGGKLTYELWRNRFLRSRLKREGIDVYHGLSNEIPMGLDRSGTRTVVTIHDLIFLTRPETFKPGMRMKLKKKTLYACRHADRIIAISQRTADDIVKFYGIDPAKIDIVYQSIDSVYFNPVDDAQKVEIREKYRLPERYILCVGTIEQRKNQELIIKALAKLPKDICAVIAGRPTPYQQRLETLASELGVENRVRILNGVPTTDLPTLYQNATIFCLPSVYEGFGLPVAEALASRVPVIAATGSCLEEAGGPDSIYIDPGDDRAMAEAVEKICSDEERRSRMIYRGAEFAKKFSDAAMAKDLMAVYGKC